MSPRIPGLQDGATLAQAVDVVAQAFRLAGIDEPQADARILAAHALDIGRAQLLAQSDRLLEAREIGALAARAARRLRREPVSRIICSREFWGLRIAIDPSVLDPRPETETVVELALDWISTRGLRRENLKILDVGTGSGALLLALLSELPNARGVGTDRSISALMLARANAQRLGFSARALFVACDMTSALAGPFELIVSNPPYIASGEIDTLAPEVRDYDPRIALDGGGDGLNAYRAIVSDASRLLSARGRLIVELGRGQADAVTQLMLGAGLAVEQEPRRDLAGINRALCATKS